MLEGVFVLYRSKQLISLLFFTSFVLASCGKNPSTNTAGNPESQSFSSNSDEIPCPSISSSDSSEISSEPLESSEIIAPCENDLHSYVTYSNVGGGHKKKCHDCGTYIGELEPHVCFSDDYQYCIGCDTFEDSLETYTLPEDFNVPVGTTGGTNQRKILSGIYQNNQGTLFTKTQAGNGQKAYYDSTLPNAKFYYENKAGDGAKLFVQTEAEDKVEIDACKSLYTYTLSVYDFTETDTFSYMGGRIKINDTQISDWLSSRTPTNEITYKYLYVSHRAKDNVTNLPDGVVMHYVTCQDCNIFLYQEI